MVNATLLLTKIEYFVKFYVSLIVKKWYLL